MRSSFFVSSEARFMPKPSALKLAGQEGLTRLAARDFVPMRCIAASPCCANPLRGFFVPLKDDCCVKGNLSPNICIRP